MKHLTEANVQISYLSEEFYVKSDESRKQKEDITHLLAQVIHAVLPTQVALQGLIPSFTLISLGLRPSGEVEAILQGERCALRHGPGTQLVNCNVFTFPGVASNCFSPLGILLDESDRDNEMVSSLSRLPQAYRDTQEELTAELADFKEKYREIAGLLHDTQEELKNAAKRRRISATAGAGAASATGAAAGPTAAYPGAGRHDVSGMFSSPPGPDESEERGRRRAAKQLHTTIWGRLASRVSISPPISCALDCEHVLDVRVSR